MKARGLGASTPWQLISPDPCPPPLLGHAGAVNKIYQYIYFFIIRDDKFYLYEGLLRNIHRINHIIIPKRLLTQYYIEIFKLDNYPDGLVFLVFDKAYPKKTEQVSGSIIFEILIRKILFRTKM